MNDTPPLAAKDAHFFRPIRGGNVYEETVQRLLQSITLGIYAPDERLPSERELAASLHVSRDTLRDALASLADAGYLVSRRGRYGGTFVSSHPPQGATSIPGAQERHSFDSEEIENILIMREILEVGAARQAASRSLSPTERESLYKTLQNVAVSDIESYRRLDSRLHVSIAEMSGSSTLVSLVADNRARANELLDSIPFLAPNIEHSNKQHEQIVMSILAGDPERAAHAMHAHLEGSAALLRGFLQ